DAARSGQDPGGRHPRARLPTSPRGTDGGDHPAPREGDGRRPAGLRAARSRKLNYGGVPGLVEVRQAFGETTLVVDPARMKDAALHLRNELGFNVLSDVAATDYLGWGEKGGSAYIGTPGGRDMHKPSTQGDQRLPQPKPRRFSVSYHLLALRA